jgi:hypothetical protein
MKECVIEHDGVLVMGGVVDAFLDAFGAYRSRGVRVLARHFGVETLNQGREQAYPVDKLLAGMKELQEQFGRGFMTRIGHSIYERAVFPPNLDSFAVALAAVDTAYYMNHQNAEGKIGHYRWINEGAARGRMVCDNPYPCAFDMGIFAGMAAQFGAGAKITHVEEQVCRHGGAEQCTYLVEW